MSQAQLDGQIRFYEDYLNEADAYRLVKIARQAARESRVLARAAVRQERRVTEPFCALPGVRQTVFCQAAI